MIACFLVMCGMISIHASRMGCDIVVRHLAPPIFYFNPRIPYGMRRTALFLKAILTPFQSTHPVWDATPDQDQRHQDRQISIHASRMGCDCPSRCSGRFRPYFNPRIPYGMRPENRLSAGTDVGISIHASRMGCDTAISQTFGQLSHFNPRIPYGMRLLRDSASLIVNGISIHASRMGCDTFTPPRFQFSSIFQSTHPVWDATRRGRKHDADVLHISIHASRMGCDRLHVRQSDGRADFNPRIPYGMRQTNSPKYSKNSKFQSTHPVWDATHAPGFRQAGS